MTLDWDLPRLLWKSGPGTILAAYRVGVYRCGIGLVW